MLLSGFGCTVTTGGDIKDADANMTSWPKAVTPRWSTRPTQAAALSSTPAPFAWILQQCIGTMVAESFRQRARFLLPPSAPAVSNGKQTKKPNVMSGEKRKALS